MSSGHRLKLFFAAAVLVSGCSSLPGLRVLTGQQADTTAADTSVEALDLVMADKSGTTDPTLSAAADRIEAASGNLDIIEIRHDLDSRVFTVNMLYSPPQVDNSAEGQFQSAEALRRAVEVTWQGTMLESEGSDVLRIVMLFPGQINTLDHGVSFVGAVAQNFEIERGAAASYLRGERNLSNFTDLIAQGTMVYTRPEELVLYEGQPNHPMYMLPSSDGQ